MAHFVAYNTEDANASKEGWVELAPKEETGSEVTLGPCQTDRAQKIGGSVWSEQTGEVLIQQSFDGEHWDLQTKTAVTAKTGTKIFEDIVAPVWRIVFISTSASKTKKLRIFARAWTSGD